MENADFRKFCEITIRPGLEEIERRRRSVGVLMAAAAANWVMLGFILVTWEKIQWWGFLIPLLFFAGLGVAAVAWWKWRALRDQFKQSVLAKVVKFLGSDMNYLPDAKVDQRFFADSQLFKSKSIDSYEGEDYVEGTLGETAFQFSEIHAQQKSEGEDSDGRSSATWTTIFRGIYFVADFNKHFQSTTVVLPDMMEKNFGFLGRALQSLNPNRDQLIKLEDPEFEREFVVYGEDQVEARYILTPALMQRMLALKQKLGTTVYFSFTGSSVHVAIATTYDCFEPRLFSSAVDLAYIESFFRDLQAITGIIEDLNLNTRIWTKT